MNRMRQALLAAAVAPAQCAAESGTQSFCFSEDFLGFAGHFPDYPILPAILQALLAQQLAEQVVGGALQFQELTRAKFTRQLRPGELIEVAVNCQEQEGHWRCNSRLSVAAEPAASFTLLLGKEAAA
jgi:3-hydroxyacyl-[acyl-carrier-protein] dehydratase